MANIGLWIYALNVQKPFRFIFTKATVMISRAADKCVPKPDGISVHCFFPVLNHILLAAIEFILVGLLHTAYNWALNNIHSAHQSTRKYRHTGKHAECVSFYFC